MNTNSIHNPLIIIPARGGSKGIPRKNIKIFAGRPLIAHTIDVALDVAPANRIILSTDDEVIAATARRCGLPVDYMRPAALATDTAGSREVILDAMDHADARRLHYDCVILLQPTSPLRTADDVRAAVALYEPDDTDMVVSVTEAACNPYYDCFEAGEDGFLHVSKGDGGITRRQDAPQAWQYNGAVYVINPRSIREMSLGAMPRKRPSPMPRERSADLDTPLDWAVAELTYNHLHEQ